MRGRNAPENTPWTTLTPGDHIQNVFSRRTGDLVLVDAEVVIVDNPIMIRHNRLTRAVSLDLVEKPGRAIGDELRAGTTTYLGDFINDHPEIGETMGQSFRFRLNISGPEEEQ